MAADIVVTYPKRDSDEFVTIEYFDKTHRYKINGEFVPSVTTVLGMFDKPGIPYWVQTVLTRNMSTLFRKRARTRAKWAIRTPNGTVWTEVTGDDIFRDGDTLLGALKALKLTFRDESAKASARGIAVHDIFEEWGKRQVIPSPQDYPQEVRPYLKALAQFLMVEQPEVEQAENVLASETHGVAGRCDTVVIMKRRNGKRVRADIKTSKSVYPETMFPQVEAYEGMDIEMRGPEAATDERAIIHLGPSGEYNPERNYAVSTATYDQFLTYLAAYRAREEIKRSHKAMVKIHGTKNQRRK